ncbi:Bicarbonate transport ATP-binding protein CmpD [Anatilimnocola aggregata]|uniref:Bicarbonate transport ATP-binding protein CmpD n=1 Tax=Anatilimnocola aggregata TaxID=2528021 RepID=A0A517Y698_9BACT|nr:ABC transporter ATP-binding protein [Anatilimnocola aggregata]QDU25746.1 Bicarbonate transport ATP-binding protein CmpD [Anatilimnocola aggregata]
MNQPYLNLKNVSKSYGPANRRNEVLANINLQVERGEFVAILGYSGSGKTTLISLIAGLQEPERGEVLIAGKRVTGPGHDRGVVFQNYSLLPWLSVFDNVLLGVEQSHPTWTSEQKREHVSRYLQMVNLAAAQQKKPQQLSGGMKQRVAVARALAMSPEMLLLDEPLAALDALTRGTLQDEIERIWEQERKTVVLITNHVDEALLLADRIIPLTSAPRATLGPAFKVDIPRPRDRQALNHDRRFQILRAEINDYLRSVKAKPTAIPAQTAAAMEVPQPIELPPRRRLWPAWSWNALTGRAS